MGERTCTQCGIADENVLHYYQKVGGSDEPIEQTACEDIDACLERKATAIGKAKIEEKHPRFFED